MKMMKKKCRAFLCLVLACLMMTAIVPAFEVDVQAADTYMRSRVNYGANIVYNGCSGYSFRMEEGQKVAVGELYYFRSGNGTQTSVSQIKGTTYINSNNSIASISTKGIFTAKKPGTAIVTIKSKGVVSYCFIQIVKKGTLKTNASKYKTIHDCANKLAAYQNKKITAKNAYAVANLWMKLQDAVSADWNLYSTGFYSNSKAKGTCFNTRYTGSLDLIEPKLVEIYGADKLNKYVISSNPCLINTKNHFEISKMTGKANAKTVTVTLKKKLSADQIFALKYEYGRDSYIKNDKQASFNLWVVDKKTGYRYRAEAVVTQGSNKMVLHTDYLKLKKGSTYGLLDLRGYRDALFNWTKTKTFKVK